MSILSGFKADNSRIQYPICHTELERSLRRSLSNLRLSDGCRYEGYRSRYPSAIESFAKYLQIDAEQWRLRLIVLDWMGHRNTPDRDFQFEKTLLAVARSQSPLSTLRRWPNRIVYASKFLHFARPEEFPIWDSFIAANFGVAHIYSFDRYLDWISKVHAADAELSEAVRQAYTKQVGYDISRVRAVEAAIYEARFL